MLTATPHQGNQSQFQALLELLRPELRDRFSALDLDSSVLAKMVFRNRKSDVTDIDGNFVFHGQRSEEHTSELQSLMRISYAVFCLKKKNIKTRRTTLITRLTQA